MKTLTCSALGGPAECQHEVSGETFAELGDNCKNHVMEQVQAGDSAHLAAIERMKNLSPEQQQAEFASYQKQFEDAPEN